MTKQNTPATDNTPSTIEQMWLMLRELRDANWLGSAELARLCGEMQGELHALDVLCSAGDETPAAELAASMSLVTANMSLVAAGAAVRRVQARVASRA